MHKQSPSSGGAPQRAAPERSAPADALAEVVRAGGELFNRAVSDGEIDPYIEALDPDVDFETFSVMAGHIVRFHGRSEVRCYIEEIARRYDELRLEISELRELGDGRFLVLGRWRGQARGGTPFGAPLATILDMRDDLICRMRAFMDEREALDTI